jgi:hypothetical protein
VFEAFSYPHFSLAHVAKRYLLPRHKRVQPLGAEIEVPGPRTCLAAACLRVGVAQNAKPDSQGLQRPCPPCPSASGLQVRGTFCVLCASTCIRKVPTSTSCTDARLIGELYRLKSFEISSSSNGTANCVTWSSTQFVLCKQAVRKRGTARANTTSTSAATRGPQTLLYSN